MHPQGVGVIRHKAEPVRSCPIIVRSDVVEFTTLAHGQEPKPGKHALLAAALAPVTFSLHHDTETIKTKTAAEPDANAKRAQHLGTSHRTEALCGCGSTDGGDSCRAQEPDSRALVSWRSRGMNAEKMLLSN